MPALPSFSLLSDVDCHDDGNLETTVTQWMRMLTCTTIYIFRDGRYSCDDALLIHMNETVSGHFLPSKCGVGYCIGMYSMWICHKTCCSCMVNVITSVMMLKVFK